MFFFSLILVSSDVFFVSPCMCRSKLDLKILWHNRSILCQCYRFFYDHFHHTLGGKHKKHRKGGKHRRQLICKRPSIPAYDLLLMFVVVFLYNKTSTHAFCPCVLSWDINTRLELSLLPSVFRYQTKET